MDSKVEKNQHVRATIKTVALDAGVSVAAVSKVLRNAYGVSETLRQKVQESIDRLGYRPNVAARGMRGRTFKIGVLLCEIENPFLTQIMDGINTVLKESNCQSLMGMGESTMPVEASLIESMIDYNMDGLILVAPQMSGAQLARFARQIPMVVIGHHEPAAASFDTVNSDDQAGAAIAVRAFLARGCRDIQMLSFEMNDPDAASVSVQREIGFARALVAAGISPEGRTTFLSYAQQDRDHDIGRFLDLEKLPRAVFCWSDIDGIRLLDEARRRGIRIPEELSVIGYDNSNISALHSINLASIDQSGARIGALAADTLQSRIAGRTAAIHLLIEPQLVARGSLSRGT
jgi:LacI family transcriptional regulator